MDTRGMASEYRLAHWTGIIREQKECGLNIREYCKNAGIKEHVYYYWLRKLREAAADGIAEAGKKTLGMMPAGFAEVKVAARDALPGTVAPCQNNISIEMPGIRIMADGGYPVDKLTAVIRELAVRS